MRTRHRALPGLSLALLIAAEATSQAPAPTPIPAAARFWRTPPKTVAKIDLIPRLVEMYEHDDGYGVEGKPGKGAAWLELCGWRVGEEGTRSYRTKMTMTLSKARPAVKTECKVVGVEADLSDFPTAWLKELKERPVGEVYLLTDDVRWFVFTSYSSSCCEQYRHYASVMSVDFIPENSPPNPRLFIGVDGCEGNLFESEECELCYEAEKKGIRGFAPPAVSAGNCLKHTDPSIVTWTKGNVSCFIDYAKCLGAR